MSYTPKSMELSNVLRMSAFERYWYAIQKMVDCGEVWSLRDSSGWVLYATEAAHECVAIWPAEAYARLCCVDRWSSCTPQAIRLSDWREKWIPGMTSDGRRIAVFPLASDEGIVVDPTQHAKDVEHIAQGFLED